MDKPTPATEPASSERYVYLVPQTAMAAGGQESDEIDVGAIIQTLKAGWKLMAVVTVLFVALGVTYSLLATEWFQAEVLLVPARKSSSLSASLGQLGGLASMAGIAIPGAEMGEPLAFLKSKDFVRDFIADYHLMPVLYAKKWDAVNQRWKGTDVKKQPDIRDAVQYFDKSLRTVSEDKKTGLVTMTVKWKDGRLAAEWANLLVKRLNDRLRQRAVMESTRSVEYLQKEIAGTNIVSLQQSLGRVLESEMQKLLLAQANEEFAFKVVDAAFEPRLRSSPKRTLIVLASLLAGLIVSGLIVLVRKPKEA